jgi:hypothetical protein
VALESLSAQRLGPPSGLRGAGIELFDSGCGRGPLRTLSVGHQSLGQKVTSLPSRVIWEFSEDMIPQPLVEVR